MYKNQKHVKRKIVAMAGASLLVATGAHAQTTISGWSFSSTVAAPDNTIAATTGSGTGNIIGMTAGGSTPSGDITKTTGTANSSEVEYMWRVRNAAGGWSLAAPEYSQGLELDASTAGFDNISFSFDWYSTTQGIRDLQFQYELNTSTGSGWVNFGGTSPTGTYVATPNDFYNAPGSPTITVDLSSIAGANNDPYLGVRLVSAYDSTGNLGNEYASATLTSGLTTEYNGSSGNWRLDNLEFTGTSVVPEPAAYPVLAVGAAALLGLIRRKK